jgi:hypothetical protein
VYVNETEMNERALSLSALQQGRRVRGEEEEEEEQQ